MARQKLKATTDQVQPPVTAGAALPPTSVTAPEGADQARAGVGGAPAETMQGAADAPMNSSAGASVDPAGEVAEQMPKEPAAVPPASGDAPAADPMPAGSDSEEAKYGWLAKGNSPSVRIDVSQSEVSKDAVSEAIARMMAGAAPAATSTTYDAKNVTVSILANPVLRVTGPAKGRWRAGRHFTPETVTIPVRDLNEDEMAALHTDPELIVHLHTDI